jgi:hypothetical protein
VIAVGFALACVGPMIGCGSGGEGGQAVQTKEMDAHLKEMTKSYGKYYADMYRNKKAAPSPKTR